ncbi:hypothetical protein FQN57_003454, partial [Myotisia sp. PD_48]
DRTDHLKMQPQILLLSIANQPSFDEIYSRLISELSNRAQLQRANTSSDALDYLSHNVPLAVLVSDPGITQPGNMTVLNKLKDYIMSGGTAIFGCQFSSFISPPVMNSFFNTHLGLLWQSGAYERTMVHLNRLAVGNLPVRDHLTQAYSQKAVFLKNVNQDAALYLPLQESNEIQGLQQAPIAWAQVGMGWVGYVGDVNAERESDEVILSMCGVASIMPHTNTDSDRPHCDGLENSNTSPEINTQHHSDELKSKREMVKDGWGTRSNFQASYGLGMTPDDIEEGDAILDTFLKADRELTQSGE